MPLVGSPCSHSNYCSMSSNILSVAVAEEFLGEKAPVLFQTGVLDGMRKAKELGYTGVELHIRNPEDLDAEAIEKLSSEIGVAVTAVGTGLEYGLNKLCFTSKEKPVRDKTVERFKEHIDLASRFNANVFVGLCRGTAPSMAEVPEYLNLFAETLLPVQEYADNKRVVLTIEPITYYMTNLLNTVEDTLKFMNRPGFEKMELLLDSHHMFLEDKDMYGSAITMCKGKIGHFHISDSNRRYPGAGNVDFDLLAESLKSVGYTGPVSLEVLPWPTGKEAAAFAIEWMKKHW